MGVCGLKKGLTGLSESLCGTLALINWSRRFLGLLKPHTKLFLYEFCGGVFTQNVPVVPDYVS